MPTLPDYRRSVYNIAPTIARILGYQVRGALENFSGINSEELVFILVDGMGVNLLQQNDFPWDYEIITSVFPSTTAAALTSIYTGLSPKEHGILEWYMYYEDCGRIIKTLPFTDANSMENDALARECEPRLFDLPRTWDEIPVKMEAYIRQEYHDSLYTRSMFRGARINPYRSFEDILTRLRKSDAQLHQIYVDYLDIAEHRVGPYGEEVMKEYRRVLRFINAVRSLGFDTLIVADHGQTELLRKHVVDLRKNEMPGGGPRDMFLYHAEELDFPYLGLEETIALLGPGREHPSLRLRLPEMLVLPDENEGVWNRPFDIMGAHGGLSEDEMLVPLVFLEGKF